MNTKGADDIKETEVIRELRELVLKTGRGTTETEWSGSAEPSPGAINQFVRVLDRIERESGGKFSYYHARRAWCRRDWESLIHAFDTLTCSESDSKRMEETQFWFASALAMSGRYIEAEQFILRALEHLERDEMRMNVLYVSAVIQIALSFDGRDINEKNAHLANARRSVESALRIWPDFAECVALSRALESLSDASDDKRLGQHFVATFMGYLVSHSELVTQAYREMESDPKADPIIQALANAALTSGRGDEPSVCLESFGEYRGSGSRESSTFPLASQLCETPRIQQALEEAWSEEVLCDQLGTGG